MQYRSNLSHGISKQITWLSFPILAVCGRFLLDDQYYKHKGKRSTQKNAMKQTRMEELFSVNGDSKPVGVIEMIGTNLATISELERTHQKRNDGKPLGRVFKEPLAAGSQVRAFRLQVSRSRPIFSALELRLLGWRRSECSSRPRPASRQLSWKHLR